MIHSSDTYRELDHRQFDGISVTLLWEPAADHAIVSVVDAKTDESFQIEVRADESALDVFRHPYAYAASRPASRRRLLAA